MDRYPTPCPHWERNRTGTNCSGTVWVGTEPRASIPVPERYRSTCPHYKQFVTERDPQNIGLGSERNGTERAIHLQMWTGGEVPY